MLEPVNRHKWTQVFLSVEEDVDHQNVTVKGCEGWVYPEIITHFWFHQRHVNVKSMCRLSKLSFPRY